MAKYVKVNKNISQRKWMYGDADRDGAKNIDDPKPLNPKVSKFNDKKKEFWYKSQYGGGEIKLSDSLLAVEKYNNSFAPKLKQVLRSNKGSTGRIKTVPSTINKLRERYITELGDIGGATIVTKNRKQAYRKEKQLSNVYTFDKASRDDYYKSPKGGVYYALHNKILLNKNNSKGIELQIKSKRMADLGKEIHPFYKQKHIPVMFKKKAKRLFDMGY